MRTAGVVVAGGYSTRMGRPKDTLDWHGSTLLYRTCAVLGRAVAGPVVVVAAPEQEPPALPDGVRLVRDPVPGLGPMQGLAAGLAALTDEADAAFVCSTDMPLLHPAFVRCVLGHLSDVDLALPVAHGFRQPLAAAYRVRLASLIAGLLADGELRLGMLDRHCTVRRLESSSLLADAAVARWDPGLDSVVNVNTPEEYAAALARELPEVVVDGRAVRAATLEAALGEPWPGSAVLNGEVCREPGFPLVAGDQVRR